MARAVCEIRNTLQKQQDGGFRKRFSTDAAEEGSKILKMLSAWILMGYLSDHGEYTLLSSRWMGRELLSGEQAGNRLVLSV